MRAGYQQAAAGQPQDSRERAAFRHMCSALTQECLDVVSTCFSLVSIECIPSGTAAEPSLVPEFYSKVMPVGQVPDAEAEAAFLALDAELSSLRTTEWWAAFAAGDRRAHGYDSIAAHLERLVPPSGLRAALDAKAPAGGSGARPRSSSAPLRRVRSTAPTGTAARATPRAASICSHSSCSAAAAVATRAASSRRASPR